MTWIAAGAGRAPTHFGMRQRAPRPVLLLIVFGLFFVIVGVTAAAQTLLVSVQVSSATLQATVAGDMGTVRTFVNAVVQPADLDGGAPAEQVTRSNQQLAAIATWSDFLRIEIRDPSGIVRLSSDSSIVGAQSALTPRFTEAAAGQVPAPQIVAPGEPEAVGPPLPARHVLVEYFPLIGSDGTTRAVVGVWRDAAPILGAVDEVRIEVVVVTLSAAAVVALLLLLVFRAAQRRISRQTEQLLESGRLDALTGLLNHGTIVGELALAIDGAGGGGAIGVALIDIDNFRGINDTHGHATGDAALLELARTVETVVPVGTIIGRYGPDECLLVAPGTDAAELTMLVEAIRADLGAKSLDVDALERLPITISAGIALYPDHGDSVTALLSQVALALAEAEAGGGDATRVAGGDELATAETRSFDVLQGLVFAIDTKDRYTKRHSEDVAQYSVFLAGLLGLDEETIAGIRSAGLLHDVGKIGIPDAILRKPGRLTDAEEEIVQQHVALGDAIVRNVDSIEIVRAGIRHHHERWDGRGYLESLAGDDIPLVARVLAVADAFSAMTTTRPYRKAMSIEEALKRLGDAAGTQLDERFTTVFIHGLETVPDAPLPGSEQAARLWVPRPVTT
jgi:diguanylate cyclase (GGDEF)-like protein